MYIFYGQFVFIERLQELDIAKILLKATYYSMFGSVSNEYRNSICSFFLVS